MASVRQALGVFKPHVVINTAASHKVDMCEDEPDKSLAVNGVGPRNLALACRELDSTLVHLSTDYVFSGKKGLPYTESDPVDPVNVYGVSKVAGEMLARYLWSKHFIVRSCGLYGIAGSSGKGGNFVELMLRLAREGKDIRVVNDQTLTPTSTVALARQIVALIKTDTFGTYHATCQGQCSWYDFAAEIFRQASLFPNLAPQTTSQSGAKATRPTFSVLDNAALRSIRLDLMPTWQAALGDYLKGRASAR
jgi:dTDP-4-dehydrorhamnose reductase